MKCAAFLFPKQNYNVLSPNSYIHISVRDFYISRIGLSIMLQPNMSTDPGNVEIGTEAAKFPEKEHINGIFLAVHSVSSELQFKIQFIIGGLAYRKTMILHF
jgi:hypothetical protein